MRKICMVLSFMLILSFGFVMAQEPGVEIGEGDVENIQGAIDDYVPIDDSGEVDFSEYKPFVSKAEERIDVINLWLDNNVGWMRFIFNMKPQISWLFIFNLYFILLFLTILVLNAEGLWFFIEKKSNAVLFGLGVFSVFAVVRLYIGLANILNTWLIYIFGVLLSVSIWLAVIGSSVLVILCIFAFPVVGSISTFIAKYLEGKRALKQKLEIATNTETLNTMLDQIKKN